MALTAMQDIRSMSNSNVATNIHIDEWVLAGHSAGAVTAMNLALEMKPEYIISKLVLCGIGSNQWDKDKTLRDASVSALVINGSQDNLVNGLSEKVRESFRNLLPPTSREGNTGNEGKTTHITIEGGNHAGFGHYGPQNRDGIRTIALEEQQRIFIETTVEFLSGNDETKKEK
jgi:alpha/beta superfamily hydrolase